ncbi:AAA family ATPase [Helicobacter sp. MIT 05-5294]|uniref:AAA family ATPase n=1 Tax=Helicobacter sp. MIT 05-5294 TaxID=1548150 RepID=UPI000AD6BF81|nr:AAA family ATPase [Helicobacter sp. MIT 05-5294]TLD85465.1 chromosome partitioning protein ParA [Helicobacter sp. MIT 05-5294]
MIIAVINEKGGSGKTTLAVNLACKLSDEGDKVLFIDSDPQRSGEIFVSIREHEGLPTAFTYKATTNALRQTLKSYQTSFEFDSIVIDTGGRDSKEMREALSIADIVLMPTYPSQYDLSVLNNMLNLYEESQNEDSKCFIVINRAYTNTQLKQKLEEFKELLKPKENRHIKLLESILYDREAFRVATANGLGITQSQNSKAKKEFNNFFKEILKVYNEN